MMKVMLSGRSQILSLALMVAFGTASSLAEAKGVAYWPLNQDAKVGNVDLRSVAGPFEFTSAVAYSSASGGRYVGVPDKLDTTGFIDTAADDGTCFSTTNGKLTAPGLDAYLDVTNSWTIEGWFHLQSLPSVGNFWPLFTTRDNDGGWLFTLRQRTAGVYDWELFANDCVNDGTMFENSVDVSKITDGWHHYALVHNYTESGIAGKGVWHFYVDGQEAPKAITNNTAVFAGQNKCNRFSICGRQTDTTAGRCVTFKADAIRISDEALSPSDFLNAGSATPVPSVTADTIGYWRLDAPHDLDNLATTSYSIRPAEQTKRSSSDHAYDTIPNASSGLPPSTGSLVVDAVGDSVTVPKAGSLVDNDKAFTLEGWFKCLAHEEYASPLGCVFGTRTSSNGFTLWYNQDRGRKLSLYAKMSDADPSFSKVLDAPSVPLAGRWAHIALTHDPSAANGKGQWEAFVDGVSLGTVTGSSSEVSGLTDLYLGGRPSGDTPVGQIDTVRLTKRVLAPREFLCAKGGTTPATTDVAALWPLNYVGATLDMSDHAGNYDIVSLGTGNRIQFSTDRAVESVPNPPADVKGNPSRNEGCLVFPESTTLKTVLEVKGGICSSLNLSKDFTLEGWLRFDRIPSSDWHVIWTASGPSSAVPRWWLGCRVMNGGYRYLMYVQTSSGEAIPDNTTFPSAPIITAADVGVWKHHALVYSASAKKFTLYVNGASYGDLSLDASKMPQTGLPFDNASVFNIGGRAHESKCFPGAMDTLRITRKALSPTEFLNAAGGGSVPVAPVTRAYWKLDSDGVGVSGLDSSVPGDWYGILGLSVRGDAEGFGTSVHNPDKTPGFIGDARANAGSVELVDAGGLTSPGARRLVSCNAAFTLEGWVKWDGTGSFPQVIASTDRAGSGNRTCWTLSLVDANTIGVQFRDSRGMVTIDTRFPKPVTLSGKWTHLAMTYSPRLGRDGLCELFADGRRIGSANALIAPSVDANQGVQDLLLGSDGSGHAFKGKLDTFRLSDGVLPKKDFLCGSLGLFIVVE